MDDTITKTKPKANRYHKAKYTTQDVRQKAIEARDELLANVDFLMEVIREDRYNLKRYKEQFGDLRYRPIITPADPENAIGAKPAVYGNPTELVLEPIASKYRATVKSLLDSINLINSQILPEDNPEGESTNHTEAGTQRQSIRDEFKAMSKNSEAFQPESPQASQSQLDADEDFTESARQGLSDAKATRTQTTIESKATLAKSPKPTSQSKPSWRDTQPQKPTPRLVPRQKPDVEEEPEKKKSLEETISDAQPKGLSPMMRARLAGMGKSGASRASRMQDIKERSEERSERAKRRIVDDEEGGDDE